jgi:hypothetical protein
MCPSWLLVLKPPIAAAAAKKSPKDTWHPVSPILFLVGQRVGGGVVWPSGTLLDICKWVSPAVHFDGLELLSIHFQEKYFIHVHRVDFRGVGAGAGPGG